MVQLWLALSVGVVVAVGACSAPPQSAPSQAVQSQAAQPVAVQPVNSEPWVGTQSPPGTEDSTSSHLPFQTPNSLPRGAATTVR